MPNLTSVLSNGSDLTKESSKNAFSAHKIHNSDSKTQRKVCAAEKGSEEFFREQSSNSAQQSQGLFT